MLRDRYAPMQLFDLVPALELRFEPELSFDILFWPRLMAQAQIPCSKMKFVVGLDSSGDLCKRVVGWRE